MERINPSRRKPILRRNLLLGATVALVCSGGFSSMGFAAPDGGVVIDGNITIDQTTPTNTIITQTSDRGIIDWRSFDIDTGELVEFKQPHIQAITVNRVKNNPQKTIIQGRIKANGNVVILNENGVMFGENSQIDVGGLVTSTSDLWDDSEFMAGGAVRFKNGNNPDAGIENKGSITAREGGLVGLVSPNVENKGVIQARFGKVQIASADIATIDFAGDGLIQIDVSSIVTKRIIRNEGVISADGGEVVLTAKTARSVIDSVIETKGTIRANTVRQSNGVIQTGKIDINAGEGNLQMSGILAANDRWLGQGRTNSCGR